MPSTAGDSHQNVNQLTEDEQIKIAKRIGLIQHLPISQYTDENFKSKKIPNECDICMNDFVIGKSFFNFLENSSSNGGLQSFIAFVVFILLKNGFMLIILEVDSQKKISELILC